MKLARTSNTILQIKKDYFCWRQFWTETRDRGLVTRAVDLLCSGQGEKFVTPKFTAYELAEPEAQAWLAYFRQIGAIASAQEVESEPVRNKSQTEDHRVWSEAVNDYVLL